MGKERNFFIDRFSWVGYDWIDKIKSTNDIFQNTFEMSINMLKYTFVSDDKA